MIYSHFSGKAALLVEASQHELDKISSGEFHETVALRQLARRWLQPDFARSRSLVAEVHCAAIRHPDVAELLAAWQAGTAERLQSGAGLTLSQVKLFYILLIGAAHIDEVGSLPVSAEETEAEMNALIEGWFGERDSSASQSAP